MTRSAVLINAQSRFPIVVLDSALEPLRLFHAAFLTVEISRAKMISYSMIDTCTSSSMNSILYFSSIQLGSWKPTELKSANF